MSSHDNTEGDVQPLDVSNIVSDTLTEEGFANQDGRWNYGPADWFLVGGRWSGELAKIEAGLSWKDLVNHLESCLTEEEKKNHDDRFINSEHLKAHKKELDIWWQKKTKSKSLHPWSRSSYNGGYSDDSIRLNQKLYDYFSNQADQDNLFSSQSEDSFIVLYRWQDGEIEYDDDTTWESLKGKWENTNPDDFLDESKLNPKDDVWLTVIDYHN